MTYSESIGFTYNGEHSSTYGIISVHTQSGLFEESFLPTRSIIEEKTFARDEPYLFGFEYSPSEIPLTLFFEDGWDETKINEVAMWLFQPNFKPLIFDEDDSRVYYCTYNGDPKIIHNGIKQGYVTISMRCNSPFSYTPVYSHRADLVINPTFTEIELFNIGHLDCFPTIQIEKVGNGDISIINYTDGGKETKITGLLDDEVVTIDGDNEDISTSLLNTYRYNNFNNNFLKLPRGINRLKITGNGILTFTYQSKRYI